MSNIQDYIGRAQQIAQEIKDLQAVMDNEAKEGFATATMGEIRQLRKLSSAINYNAFCLREMIDERLFIPWRY